MILIEMYARSLEADYSRTGCKAYRIGSRRHVRALLSANRILYRRLRITHDFISANERLIQELKHFIRKMQVLQSRPDAAILRAPNSLSEAILPTDAYTLLLCFLFFSCLHFIETF